jgi:hypothetical protein
MECAFRLVVRIIREYRQAEIYRVGQSTAARMGADCVCDAGGSGWRGAWAYYQRTAVDGTFRPDRD